MVKQVILRDTLVKNQLFLLIGRAIIIEHISRRFVEAKCQKILILCLGRKINQANDEKEEKITVKTTKRTVQRDLKDMV